MATSSTTQSAEVKKQIFYILRQNGIDSYREKLFEHLNIVGTKLDTDSKLRCHSSVIIGLQWSKSRDNIDMRHFCNELAKYEHVNLNELDHLYLIAFMEDNRLHHAKECYLQETSKEGNKTFLEIHCRRNGEITDCNANNSMKVLFRPLRRLSWQVAENPYDGISNKEIITILEELEPVKHIHNIIRKATERDKEFNGTHTDNAHSSSKERQEVRYRLEFEWMQQKLEKYKNSYKNILSSYGEDSTQSVTVESNQDGEGIQNIKRHIEELDRIAVWADTYSQSEKNQQNRKGDRCGII